VPASEEEHLMEDERVMIFIDGNNLYHELKGHFGRSDLDFAKFCQKLAGRRTLVRTYYYNASVDSDREPDRHSRQLKFFRSLQRLPYFELRLGRLVYFDWPKQPPIEKGVDVKLSTDMVVHAFRNSYDTAILVSGDTDYSPALQAVKDQGKHVESALFGKQTSMHLREISDRTIEINKKFLSDCWAQAPG
jgi:uncharacterized LabA/DUF88 family protein